MKIEKGIAVSRTTDEAKTNIIASIEFAVRASLREEYADSDFVHSILGRVSAKSDDLEEGEDAGYIKASLVQFGEAMDHGISTDRLGDGIEGSIAEYWELLFDLETGCWREEIQDEYEASGCDLLIIDCMEIRPRWRGMGVGPAALLASGFRDREVRHVAWRDMDFRNSLVRVTAKPLWGFGPKNWEERAVPLPTALVEQLQRLRERRNGLPSQLVFPNSKGNPDSENDMIVKRVAERAELNCGQCVTKHGNKCAQGPHCRHFFLHKFRHYAEFRTMPNMSATAAA
jgi:hypothetical protein